VLVSEWSIRGVRIGYHRAYMSYFPNGKPARSTTEARLMVDAKVEIDVIAYKPKG
jgi:enamine deaminase RidA (YjgF/YER057c/UK114 family)